MTNKSIRVLWLLNHTTLRRFEVKQLNTLGIEEFFCPKNFAYNEGNLSASVDYSFDSTLSIPQADLAVLNQQNWYESPSEEAWRIANQYFDIAIIGFFPQQIAATIKYFQGSIVLRVFGLAKGYSYTQILGDELGPTFIEKIRILGERFWFGSGYEHLKEEGLIFKKRDCFLPVGLEGKYEPSAWKGSDKRIFFVCPRIETSPYFKSIYKNFVRDFVGFGYQIGGAQPIRVNDPNVLGFVPYEVHEYNMREMRVMFYHSSEPNHIHYHPFEDIRAGMPLVFMAGGILDRFGGINLPGRCTTIKEARKKIERILNDDWDLIEAIRKSQACLLEPMKPENCEAAWRQGFQRIIDGLEKAKATKPLSNIKRKKRIAVIVPVGYRGGSLRGAKLLAQAIEVGSQQANQGVEVILAHLDDPASYPEEEFADLPSSIKRRPFNWRFFGQEEAYRAMAYAGLERPMASTIYQAPDDGIKQFMDCDLWVIISDRLEHPLLPIRPYVLMVYDYLQRYELLLPQAINQKFISAAHTAERVFVTTEFTRQDAIQFAGLPSRKVCKLPMLAPEFSAPHSSTNDSVTGEQEDSPYFLWTTNLASHKNHENALKALRIYYEQLGGQMECRVTGVNTKDMLKSNLPHLIPLRDIVATSSALKHQLKLLGELPDLAYQKQLIGSAFLWHAGRMDNGTFAVVEAAHMGVPALSSDYPAMREIDAQFGLNLSWTNARSPDAMAKCLKMMEVEATALRKHLPNAGRLATQSTEQLASTYWHAVRDCL